MNKLEEFYANRDVMAKYFSEEELKLKEEALLQEELATAISKSVAQVFSGVSSPIRVTIDYEPQGDITVKIARKNTSALSNVNSEIQGGQVVREQPADEPQGKGVITRSESIGFTVSFPDGTVVQRKKAKDTMIATLKVIGLHRVAAFRGRLFKGFPLVSRNQRTDAGFKCQELVDGWYVYTNMGNEVKMEVLQQISDEFGLNLKIVDENGRLVSWASGNNRGNRKQNKRTMYMLSGDGPYNKRDVVLMAVTRYMMEHPDSTYEQIEMAFPKELQGSYGVVRPMSWIEDRAKLGSDAMDRFYTLPNDILTSSDGIRFAVSKEWGHNFANLVDRLKNFGWEVSEYRN